VPNFIKIGHTVAEIWLFNGFQNGGRPPSWILKFKFLTIGAVKRHIMHQHTKFCKARSNRDFCDFSRWWPPPSWIFKNSKF